MSDDDNRVAWPFVEAIDAAAVRLARENADLRAQVAYLAAERKRDVDAFRESLDRVQNERAELRAIIAGRTTPPTDEEIEAHYAARGRWAVSTRDRSAELITLPIAALYMRDERPRGYTPVRWVALDAECRPCAWPVVEAKR